MGLCGESTGIRHTMSKFPYPCGTWWRSCLLPKMNEFQLVYVHTQQQATCQQSLMPEKRPVDLQAQRCMCR